MSNLPHPHPMSNLPHPMSNLPHSMSNLPHPMSNVPHPMSNLPHPMANLPHPMSSNPNFIGPMPPPRISQQNFFMPQYQHLQSPSITRVDGYMPTEQEKLVLDITNPNDEVKEMAIAELSMKKELHYNLGPLLMNSFGTMTELLKEVVSIYHCLSPPTLSPNSSDKTCNALSLLQCVASHPETKMLFLEAHFPLFLYPFLNTTSRSKPFDYLRLTTLGVIGSLVKTDSPDVVCYLVTTEIVPLCLQIIEMGCELSKSVATYIVLRIIHDEIGLKYILEHPERLFIVGEVLGNLAVSIINDHQSIRLIKNIIRCFLRISEDDRACEILREFLPNIFINGALHNLFVDDNATSGMLNQLIHNVNVALGISVASRVLM
ncbi:putative Cell differentiation protein rcd1 [Zostera marina]|uniref:Putative Cell differentiation protein rcd1 n=1 Tax=Zostera marina TaxID=29655 RepID=A0A0K9PAM8_ZOSMR|nr:putative Cell differentiation protein rcd1 [Zostera marina]